MQEPKEEEVGEEDVQFEKVVPIPLELEGAGMSSWTVSGAGDESYNGVYEEVGTYNGYPYYQKGEGDNARYLFVAYREILNDIWGYIWALGPGLDGNLAYHPEHSPGSEPVPLPDNPWSVGTGTPPAPTLSEMAYTADKPQFLSDRTDKRVNVETGMRPYTWRAVFSVRFSFGGDWQEGLSYKLYGGTTLLDSGAISESAWTGYLQWTGDPAVLGVGVHQLRTELYLNDVLVATSPESRCEIVAPLYDLLDDATATWNGRMFVFDERPGYAFGDIVVSVASSQRRWAQPIPPYVVYFRLDGGAGEVPNRRETDAEYGETDKDVSPAVWVEDSDTGPRSDYDRENMHGEVPWPGYPFYGVASGMPVEPTEEWIEHPDGSLTSAATVTIRMYADRDISPDSGYNSGDLIDETTCDVILYRPPQDPYSGGGDIPDPPQIDLTCAIVQPPAGSYLSGTAVYVVVATSGGWPPYTVACQFGDLDLGELTEPNYSGSYRFGPVNTEELADGEYTIHAQAQDSEGTWASASRVVYVTNGPEIPLPAEDNPPRVYITEPAYGAQVAGTITVTVHALDDRGLALLRLYAEGALVRESSLSGTDATVTVRLDTRDWSNGPHNITAWVWDTGGKTAYSAIMLSFANGLADTTKVLFTTPVSLTRSPVLGMLVAQLDDPPEDPRYRYNVYGGYIIDSDSGDFDQYTRVPLNRSHAVPAEATTIKWALQAVPQVQVGYWDLAAEAVRSLFVGGRDLYAITWPPAVYRLVGADWVLVVAEDLLPTETYASCAYADGKVYIATDQRLIAMDLDAGDATVLLGMPVQVRVLAAESSGSLLCWGADALWRFTWPSTKRLGTAAYPVWTMTPGLGGTYLMGTTDGKVVSGTPGSWTEAVLPGAGAIWWLGQLGTTWYAAGAGGIWQYTGSAWVRELEAEGCHRAVATAMGYGWAIGQGEYLWRRGTTAWAAANALEGMVDGYCLLERNGVLYIGGTGGTESPTARVWVYRVDEGGTPSGPEPPDVMGKILREVDG